MLAHKSKTVSSSSISPIEGPGSHLSSVSKATAAKEAAKILLGGAGGGSSSEVCAPSRGFQSVFSSFVLSVSVSLLYPYLYPFSNSFVGGIVKT